MGSGENAALGKSKEFNCRVRYCGEGGQRRRKNSICLAEMSLWCEGRTEGTGGKAKQTTTRAITMQMKSKLCSGGEATAI